MSEEQWIDFYKGQNIECRVNHYSYNKKIFHYASIGKDNLPALLFLAETSSIENHAALFKDQDLLREFSIYVSVVGTNAGRTSKIISIQQQAEVIYPLAERIHRVHQPLIIIASKYVAAAACQLIADHPGIIQGMVLIDPVLKVDMPAKNWFRSFLAKVLGGHRKTRKNGNKKEMLFRKQLENMEDVWKKIQIPVVYIQSEKNSRSDAAFISRLFMHTSHLDIDFYKTDGKEIEIIKARAIKNKLLHLSKAFETV